jgi:FkbM family methyltransferase
MKPRTSAFFWHTPLGTATVPLHAAFRLLSRRQRGVFVRIPGLLRLYRCISRKLVHSTFGDVPYAATVHGLKMYLDVEEEPGRLGSFLWGEYEPLTTYAFRHILKEGDVAVDVGAHWGYFTLLAAKLCGPSGKVFAFEPHPRNLALLMRNIHANGLTNVAAIQKAVSDKCAVERLFTSHFTAGHSLIPPAGQGPPPLDSPRALQTPTVSLDSFFAGRAGPLRLVKIDVEGAERLVLAGMRELVQRCMPKLVVVAECNSMYYDAGAIEDLVRTLAELGLRVSIADDEALELQVGCPERIVEQLVARRGTVNLLCMQDSELVPSLGRSLGRWRGGLLRARVRQL